jgi:class 3 adenylate cyclase/tetratricopeptide (TPR) repeat protein
VTCSSCGAENAAGAKFCNECGARLAAVCPSCATPNAPTAKFCSECGTLLTAGDVATPPRTAPTAARAAGQGNAQAERRLVTVLFADLVGFTPFAEERDAEDVRDTLTRYFDLASDVIARYGGTVEKFIGDAVMAVWGAPTAHEDDAERAVRAALDLVVAVRGLGPSIQARAGVLTGEAAVTLGATNQGMVAGDLVNTASRLQSVAPPGTVLVGEPTQRAASRAIAFEEAGEQLLKGKASPVPAWRALRVVAQRGGRNRSDTLEAPFVGRDDELRQLKDLFHATSRDRRPRLVSVIGPAGIGKSRLAWELHKYLDGLVEPIWAHDGRSPAYGEGISFWALGEMVRGRAGLLETDDESTTRAKVTATLERHVPDPEERRWIEPAILALLGLERSSVGSEQRFGAWRTFFERLAGSAPVVMIFEDFHFADAGLIDFVDHLLEWSRNVPIFVVTLARPSLLDKRPTWGAGKRNFTSIYLEPLPEPAMRELLAGLVPGLPESAVRAIVARADGVPLYAVETVRMLVAEGRLVAHDDGAYAPAGDLTTLAVPETLTALIASRLDALAPDDRALVSDAAVIGQSFTLASLAAVSGIVEPALEPRLHALVRRELLTVQSDPRSPERGQYGFVQALIREVAYNTLARPERRARHLAAARHFESIGSDELAGALAGHYLAAHDNAAAGPEADALAAQARITLRGAAERAAALGAHEQAIAFLEQALGVASDPGELADLYERMGQEAAAAARHDDAERFLREAADRHRASGNSVAAARATASLGRALLTARRSGQALGILEQAAVEFADLADDAALVALHGQLARCYMFGGDRNRAIDMADRALAVAEHGDLVEPLADALVTKGSVLCDLGRLREGIGVIEVGERLARAHGFVDTLLRALNNRTISQGDIDPLASLEANREGLALARRVGRRNWVFSFAVGVGFLSFLVGDWDASAVVLAEALADDPPPEHRVDMLANALLVPAYRGEPVDETVAEIARLVGDSAEPAMLMQLQDARGNAAFAGGRLAEAVQNLHQAAGTMSGVAATGEGMLAARAALWQMEPRAAVDELVAIDQSGFRAPAVEARRSTIRAGLAALEGRTADALALYRDALRTWRDLGLSVDEAMTGIDMAVLLDPGDADVRGAIDASREILSRLGARTLLDRLDEAAAGRRERSGVPLQRVASSADAQVATPDQ